METWGNIVETMNYSVLLDGLIVLGMVGLWYLWWQQSKHRGLVEESLIQASAQLQEATHLLDEALKQIAYLKEQESIPVAPIPHTKKDGGVDDGVHVEFSQQARKMKHHHAGVAVKTKRAKAAAKAPQSAQMAQILRMQREGEKAEDIARDLDLPLAQVKLMLMLQGAS